MILIPFNITIKENSDMLTDNYKSQTDNKFMS